MLPEASVCWSTIAFICGSHCPPLAAAWSRQFRQHGIQRDGRTGVLPTEPTGESPRSFEVILLPHFVARTFCGRLIEQYAKDTDYFNPCQDWPHPMEVNAWQRLLSKPLPMKISTGPTCANEAVACACVQTPKQPLLMCAAHFTEEWALFLVKPSMCCAFICTNSRKTSLCCAFYWRK